MVIAAGAAGLIKTALALRDETHSRQHCISTPPIRRSTSPAQPFVVNDRAAAPGRAAAGPRRAGVSSFGVGGTNAHVVLEEAPPLSGVRPGARARSCWCLSARTPAALAHMAMARLADHLEARPDVDLADVAHTLRVGRTRLRAPRARVVAAIDAATAASLRAARAMPRAARSRPRAQQRRRLPVPGAGRAVRRHGPGTVRQRAGVPRRLRRMSRSSCSRSWASTCAASIFGDDADALGPTARDAAGDLRPRVRAGADLAGAGVRPAAMIGHSVGEFVAAALAGVMSLDDALRLVAARGALMQALPPGGMLSVRLPADGLRAAAAGDDSRWRPRTARRLRRRRPEPTTIDAFAGRARGRGRRLARRCAPRTPSTRR